MKKICHILSGCLAVAMSLSVQAGQVFNVRDFGAKGDGQTFDTAAIQQALDACTNGGTVRFPAGDYLSRPLTIHSRTTFQVEAGAKLQASTNQSDFMKVAGDWLKAKGNSDFIPFIGGKDLVDVTFTGDGIIDGNGGVWWGEAEKARQIRPGYTLPRPNLIVLERCKNVRIENLTLQNSPKSHLVPLSCDDVVISNATIRAPETAANTDAIDPSGHRILITKCRLDVGDDNVAIKANSKVEGRFQSEDITVTDCQFLHGHGMSIGSETVGGVRNVTVKHCFFANTDNGIRIKSDVKRGGIVENIVYDDITMSNVIPAVTFTCVYTGSSAGDTKRGLEISTNIATGDKIPMFRNIRVSNLKAVSEKSAGIIEGLPQSCISNVVFENVEISAPKGMTIKNARGIEFRSSKITAKDGPSIIPENAEVTGLK